MTIKNGKIETNNTNPATAANNIPAINFRAPIHIEMPITFNFNAPISLTYNGKSDNGSISDKPVSRDCDCTPTSKPTAPKSSTNDNAYKYDEKRGTGVAEASLENQIFDKIVERFKVKRDSLISITPFISAYEMYAVGTRGDVTYLAWVHPSGQIYIQQQCW